MIKKKTTKSKKAGKKAGKKKGEAKAKAETNPAEVRKEVSELVKAHATEMAQAVIGEGNKGQLAPVKYLFEVASIFPPADDGTQATTEEDCLAKILIERLKLAAAPGEKNGEAGEGAAEDARPTTSNEAGGSDPAGEQGDSGGDEAKVEADARKEVLV
ncbi:MAG: hypothetical protein ABSE40_00130 [Candidatus Sulfotelmatobacter sp.]|jgi:hypothetical protein